MTKAKKVGEIVRKNETVSWDSGPKADKSAKGWKSTKKFAKRWEKMNLRKCSKWWQSMPEDDKVSKKVIKYA